MDDRKTPFIHQAPDDNPLHERELLRALMDNIPDTIYFKDRQSRFILINRAQALLLGIENPDTAVGKTDFDFFARETAQESFDDEQKIMASATPLIDKAEELHFPDGHTRWVSATKVPLCNAAGEICGIIGISRDVHERILMEEKLRQEHTLLRTLIDNMPDFIYVKDRRSRFLINNQAQRRQIGVEKLEEVVGKTDFDFFPVEYAQKYYDDEQMIMSTGRSLVSVEEAMVTKAGEHRWLSTTKVPLRAADGGIIGIVGISRDITERKRIDEQMQRSKDELENRVLERTAALKLANVRIEIRLNQLNFLNRTSYTLAQIMGLENLYPAIVEAFVSRFGRAEACLCVKGKRGFFCVHATPGLDSPKARQNCEKALSEYEEKDMQTPVVVEDWTTDKWLRHFPWSKCRDLTFYIAIPLLADNTMISCVQIFTSPDSRGHFEREKPLLTTLAAHAAVCQSNAQHYKELGEQARLEGELEAARSIQRGYMPQERPPIPHINLKGVYFPAFEVGGDYLDYFQTPAGSWVLVIADVCGKGIPAALHMTVLRSAFRAESLRHCTAKEIMCAVNSAMKIHLDNKSFITALCLVINAEGTSMTYARAGHPLLLRLGAGNERPANIDAAGVALGLISEADRFAALLEEKTIPLEKGERYILYTDGLTEALNEERETYGFKRLCALLEKEHSRNPEKIVSSIMNDVNKFKRAMPFHDDLTMLVMTVT